MAANDEKSKTDWCCSLRFNSNEAGFPLFVQKGGSGKILTTLWNALAGKLISN